MKKKRDEGYCKGCAKLYRKCAGFYAYPNPECYVEKTKPDSYTFLIELNRNLNNNER
jgi:hypothetical protein